VFAIIDCGTTNTRVYLLNAENQIVGQGVRRVGVRNTSMTGSNAMLKQGICEAILEAADNAGIAVSQIAYAVASGMITSEIGLVEIPHLVCPIGLEELAEHAVMTKAGEWIPLPIPILFIRGVRNDYGEAILKNIRNVDFMRGEETQMMGILEEYDVHEPVNVIVLSSHTKIIHANGGGQIEASLTTLSGQLYEAICKETMIGKSLSQNTTEESGGYTFEEIVNTAADVVRDVGLDRGIMIPRFLQVLLKTDFRERNLFIDAAIAADDMRMIEEFESQGYQARKYILFGQESRCALYAYLLRRRNADVEVVCASDSQKLSDIMVKGAIRIVKKYKQIQKEKTLCFE